MTDDIRRRLLAQAYLFDDQGAYRAGVEDAISALESAGIIDDVNAEQVLTA